MFDEMRGQPDVQQLFLSPARIDQVNDQCYDQ